MLRSVVLSHLSEPMCTWRKRIVRVQVAPWTLMRNCVCLRRLVKVSLELDPKPNAVAVSSGLSCPSPPTVYLCPNPPRQRSPDLRVGFLLHSLGGHLAHSLFACTGRDQPAVGLQRSSRAAARYHRRGLPRASSSGGGTADMKHLQVLPWVKAPSSCMVPSSRGLTGKGADWLPWPSVWALIPFTRTPPSGPVHSKGVPSDCLHIGGEGPIPGGRGA